MTEDEWNSCIDPQAMLEFVHTSGKASDRKMRLVLLACCGHAFHLFANDRTRNLLRRLADDETNERELLRLLLAVDEPFAENGASQVLMASVPEWWGLGLSLLNGNLWGHQRWLGWLAQRVHATANDTHAALHPPPGEEVRAARNAGAAAESAKLNERKYQSHVIRDLFGNPFRPAPTLCPSLLTSSAHAAAQEIYDNCPFPERTLDPARLAVLADALEAGGCTDTEMLAHLRSPGPHVKGYWALDLIAARS